MSFTPLVRLIPSYFIIFEAIVNESMSIICFSVCAHVKRRGDQEKPVAPGHLWPERQKAGWKVGRDTSRECAQTERPIVSLRELLLRNWHPRCSSGVTVAMKESGIYRGEQQTRKGFKIISTGHDDFREKNSYGLFWGRWDQRSNRGGRYQQRAHQMIRIIQEGDTRMNLRALEWRKGNWNSKQGREWHPSGKNPRERRERTEEDPRQQDSGKGEEPEQTS